MIYITLRRVSISFQLRTVYKIFLNLKKKRTFIYDIFIDKKEFLFLFSLYFFESEGDFLLIKTTKKLKRFKQVLYFNKKFSSFPKN